MGQTTHILPRYDEVAEVIETSDEGDGYLFSASDLDDFKDLVTAVQAYWYGPERPPFSESWKGPGVYSVRLVGPSSDWKGDSDVSMMELRRIRSEISCSPSPDDELPF